MANSDDSPPSGAGNSDNSGPLSNSDSSDDASSSSEGDDSAPKTPSSLGLDLSSAADEDDGISIPKPSEATSNAEEDESDDSVDGSVEATTGDGASDESPSETMLGGFEAQDVRDAAEESSTAQQEPTESAEEILLEEEEFDPDPEGADSEFDVPESDGDASSSPEQSVTSEGSLDGAPPDDAYADAETEISPGLEGGTAGSAPDESPERDDEQLHGEASLEEGGADDDYADAKTEISPGLQGGTAGSAPGESPEEDDEQLHGEASLDGEDEEAPDGDFDGYERTVVSDQSYQPSSDASDEPANAGEAAPEEDAFTSAPTPTDLDDTGASAGTSTPSDSTGSDTAQRNPPPPEQTGSAPSRRPDDSRTAGGRGRPGGPDSSPDPPPGDANEAARAKASRDEADPESGPEAEFEGEETELFDSPFENDPICPRLTVLDGPSAGQEFLLNSMRNSVGRSTNNAVVIRDEAMSRQHMEIVRNPDDTYTLKDLQSVNGTYLNGTQVREADLFHGDRIKVGKTTFQFVIPGESAPARGDNRRLVPADDPGGAAPTREHTPETAAPKPPGGVGSDDQLAAWLNWIIVGAVALSVPLAGVTIWLVVSGVGEQNASAEKADAAKEAYLSGVQAIRTRNWSEASRHFEKTKRLNPDFEGLDSQLQRLQMEREAQKSLEQARSKIDDGATDRAVELAEAIPRESVYYKDGQELIREQQKKQKVGDLYEKAQTQFENDANQQALATIQRILERAPDHDDSLELRRKIVTETEADLEEAREKTDRERQTGTQGDRQQATDEASDDSDEQKAVAARDPAPTRRDNTRSNSTGNGDEESDSDDSWLIDEEGDSSASSEESSSSDEAGGLEPDETDETGGNSGGGGGGRVVNFTEGFTLYQRQEFGAAIDHFEEAASKSSGSVAERARSAAETIRSVSSAFESGTSALKSENWKTAASEFREALRADQDVASSGFLKPTIDKKLAHATAGEGVQAVAAENYSTAFEKYKQAKGYDASHPKVDDLLDKLEEEATSLYIKAANKRKTNPSKSASLCRKIMSMVPPDNESYQKAEKLLAEL